MHNVEVVESCCDMPEVEVIHPIVNKTGEELEMVLLMKCLKL